MEDNKVIAKNMFSSLVREIDWVYGSNERKNRQLIRTILEMMRTPTEEMRAAVRKAEIDYDDHEAIPWEYAWRVAIDSIVAQC